MIGKITGIFSGYYGNIALIDVCFGECKVGYEILMKSSDIVGLENRKTVTVYIKEIVKEDDYFLYGFLDFKEKCWFEELIKLSGLGPKSALAILSAYSCDDISNAIIMNDCNFFESVSGIGSKIANRIPKEMNKNLDKINERIFNFSNFNEIKLKKQDVEIGKKNLNKKVKNNNTKLNDSSVFSDNNLNLEEAVNALVALGISKQEAYRDIYQSVKQFNITTTEELVKKVLQKKDR